MTQLYISVDAPTASELKAVDRPLFPDFWERFLACVDLLRAKRQRTVFRMTLVNGWNTQQLAKYVELIRRGRPDFVEVKGGAPSAARLSGAARGAAGARRARASRRSI